MTQAQRRFHPIPDAVLKDRGLWEQDDLILARLRILTCPRVVLVGVNIKKLRLNVIFKDYRRRPYGQCIKNIQQRKSNQKWLKNGKTSPIKFAHEPRALEAKPSSLSWFSWKLALHRSAFSLLMNKRNCFVGKNYGTASCRKLNNYALLLD